MFKNKVRAAFHLDLNGYKEKQLKRRLDTYLARQKAADYGELFNRLTTDRKSYEDFLDYLTINVSEFFRDPLRFEELKNKYIPGLATGKNRINIWSAACSNGSEPYSVAIIMEELGLSTRHKITATDIDRQILLKAQQARYTRESLKNVDSHRLEQYFDRDGESYTLKEKLRRKVDFRYHDLLSGQYDSGYDLILCRNVTIYFTKEAQDTIYKKFNRALNTGGILFIGGSEMIFNYRELGFYKMGSCFYQKVN